MKQSFLIVTLIILAAAAPVFPVEKRAFAIESTAFFAEPGSDALPAGYVDKRDTCRVDSTVIDSAGGAWFRMSRASKNVWVAAKSIRFVADSGDGESAASSMQSDAQRKQRMDAIKNHPDWPRRIKKAVHEGKICLDMTEEQLLAAWEVPARKSKAFILGIGDHVTWIYKNEKGDPLIVHLQNGRVIGWMLE